VNLDLVVRATNVGYRKVSQEWENFWFQNIQRLYGFHASVVLSFSWLGNSTNSNQGVLLMRNLYTLAVSTETHAALQFSLFADSAAPAWRGMVVRSDFNPQITEKQRLGFTLDLEMETRDLFSAVGDWTAATW
jgi:hypothetical protein